MRSNTTSAIDADALAVISSNNESTSTNNVVNSSTVISEISISKTISQQETATNLMVESNLGTWKRFETMSHGGNHTVATSASSSATQNFTSTPTTQIPIVSDEDDENQSHHQLTLFNNAGFAVVPTTQGGPLNAVDFVAVPITPVVSLTLPLDPYSFEHFKDYIKSKVCYHSAPLDQSKLIRTQECVAYRVDLWTLMENRTLSWSYKPYHDEIAEGKTVVDVFTWEDIPVSYPSADINQPLVRTCELPGTDTKILCRLCKGKGRQQCRACYGQGHVVPRNTGFTRCAACTGTGALRCASCDASGHELRVAVVTFSWESIATVNCYQNTFLPEKLIRLRRNKKLVFNEEIEWNSSMVLTKFDGLLEAIQNQVPPDLQKGLIQDIQKQYQTHYIRLRRPRRITRIKCLIRQVDIIEVDYRLDGYINKTERNKGTDIFTYLLYGIDEDNKAMIYENDYPINCCGCLGPKVGCKFGCLIS